MMRQAKLPFHPIKRLASAARHQRVERKRSIMNDGHELYFDGDSLYAVTPEGKCGSMRLDLFFDKVNASHASRSRVIPPKGVIREWTLGNVVIWLYEREPQPYNFKWIARDSASRFGRGTKYREVSITLPYLLVFAVFAVVSPGLSLTSANEAYFRNRPVTSPDDEVCFPALLNCSKFATESGRPLSWICTQYLDRSFDHEQDLNRRMRGGLKSLLQCLLESGFNYSSEHHEGASWFSESRQVDERISTIENWETASKADPLFVLDVPWLKTGLTVSQVVERIFQNLNASRPTIKTAADVARIIFNQKQLARPSDPSLLF